MKKLIIVIVLVLAALLFGAPYYSGKVAETETLKLVEKINQSAEEYGSTEVLSYDRGVRTTSARYKYTPPAPFAAFSKEFGEVIYACESSHGIAGIDYECALEGESVYSKFVAEKLDGKDPLSVYGSISAFGGINQTITLDEVKGLEVDGATLNFPKARLSIDTDANASVFKINGGSDAFEMEGSGEMLSVGKVTLEGDFTQIAGSLFTGEMQLSADHFDMTGALGDTSFKGLTVTSDASEQGDTLSSKVNFSVDKIQAAGSPFESVEDLSFGLDFSGLDKQSVIDYQEFAQQMQRDTLAALENDVEPQSDPLQMAKLMPILEGMLKQGLEISSRANAKLNGKTNKIGLDLKLLDSLSIAQLSLFMTNPEEALKKFDVSLDASLNKNLVDAQPMVAAFIAQSPLVATGNDDYTLDLKLGKQIELNGKKMNFVELQTLVFSSMPF